MSVIQTMKADWKRREWEAEKARISGLAAFLDAVHPGITKELTITSEGPEYYSLKAENHHLLFVKTEDSGKPTHYKLILGGSKTFVRLEEALVAAEIRPPENFELSEEGKRWVEDGETYVRGRRGDVRKLGDPADT